MRTGKTGIILSLIAAAGLAFAQDAATAPQDPNVNSNGPDNGVEAPPPPPPPQAAPNGSPSNGGWRRLGTGDAAPAQQRNAPPPQYPQQQYPPQPQFDQNGVPAPPPPAGAQQGPQGGQPYPPQGNQPYPPQGQPYPPQGSYQAPPPLPAELHVPAGTFVTVRLNQLLTSDHSQVGDGFSATLIRPLIVDGVVVADRGQTIAGRVTEVQKAGRVEGTSKLGIELTEISLVDGSQLPLKTQFISRQGPTTVGRDVAAVGGTTALGAALGAAVGWGRGAAIGAGAGAAAGLAGVLLTRGAPTVIAPESMLTFRIEAPLDVNTTRAPQAFRYVNPGDYQQAAQPGYRSRPPAPYGPYGPYSGPYYGGPYYAGPYYGYPYYPYYYGPSIGFGIGFGRYGRWR